MNVGSSGAACDAADNSDRTIMQILLATTSMTDETDQVSGFAHAYDRDGDGTIDADEARLRRMANDVFSMINEQGDI